MKSIETQIGRILLIFGLLGAYSLGSFLNTQPPDAVTPRPASRQSPEKASFIQDVRATGLSVSVQGPISPPWLSSPGESFLIGDEAVHVFSFSSLAEAAAAADYIAPKGIVLAPARIQWKDPIHIYLGSTLLVVYSGYDPLLLSVLETILGNALVDDPLPEVDSIRLPEISTSN